MPHSQPIARKRLPTPEKLIRDNIPKIAADHDDHLITRDADPCELPVLLRMKLAEEAIEVADAGEEDVLEELADVLEVIRALAALYGYSPDDIERVRAAKAAARGGFGKGLVMELPNR